MSYLALGPGPGVTALSAPPPMALLRVASRVVRGLGGGGIVGVAVQHTGAWESTLNRLALVGRSTTEQHAHSVRQHRQIVTVAGIVVLAMCAHTAISELLHALFGDDESDSDAPANDTSENSDQPRGLSSSEINDLGGVSLTKHKGHSCGTVGILDLGALCCGLLSISML